MAYKQVHKPDHPRADIFGYVPEHILVVEQGLGRLLVEGEIVHHKDWYKLNNQWPDNLQVMTRPQHQRIPELQARFICDRGLLDEFFVWWEQVKDGDPVKQLRQLEYKLVEWEHRAERKQRRQQQKAGI